MDELARELIIMECEEEFEEWRQAQTEDERPIWWKKINGLCDSVTEQEYQQARKIHEEFKVYSNLAKNAHLSVEQLFNAFEHFKLQGGKCI